MIEKAVTHQLPSPYSQCSLEETSAYEEYKSNLEQINLDYSTKSCIYFCYNEFSKKNPNLTDFLASWENHYENFCLPRCPEKCDKTEFNIKMSYLAFPTKAYFENNNYSQLNFTNDFSQLEKSVLRLKFYYSLSTKLTYYTIKCTIDDLISKIGGTLGCFLGASLISLVEIFELIVEIALKMLNREN